MQYTAWVDGACAVNSTKCGGIGVVLRMSSTIYNKRNWDRMPPNAVMIDRTTDAGNPFHIGKDGDRAEVISKFRHLLDDHPDRVTRLTPKLLGKDWVCWCKPEDCHGDVWNEVLYSKEESSGHWCHTTNNRMELQAVIEALDMVPPGAGADITIYSDSQVVVGGFEWGYSIASNTDLWEEAFHLADARGIVKLEYIPRCSTLDHERADTLAKISSRIHPPYDG